MIYAITPNPALDVSGVVDRIMPNEKNYVFDEVRSPGGNAINCARMVRRLGGAVLATGFLGGAVGEEIQTLLDQEKVAHDFVTISDHTRINVTVSNRSTHQQTRLSFPGPTILPSEVKKLHILLRRRNLSILVIGGSLPSGFSAQTLRELIGWARQRGILTIVDVPSRALRVATKARPTFIKPNLTEFQEMVGRKVSTIPAIIREVRTHLRHVALVCISSVAGGALLITPQNAWYGKGPKIKAKSTVGAGDSMVGAIAAELAGQKIDSDKKLNDLLTGGDWPAHLLRKALAAALATVAEPGMTLGTASEIRVFEPRIYIETIN